MDETGYRLSEASPGGLGFLGAGGHALEVLGYCDTVPVFCAVERQYMDMRNQGFALIDIAEPPDEMRTYSVVAAVGAPGAKARLIELWPGKRFTSIIARDSTVATSARLGTGAVIAPGARIMGRVRLGDHVLASTNCVISHESEIGDFSTVSPGVNIGGRCNVAEGVFIGIGATIVDGVSIGPGAVVGAGALVREDVMPFEVVVGVPSRHLRYENSWLLSI